MVNGTVIISCFREMAMVWLVSVKSMTPSVKSVCCLILCLYSRLPMSLCHHLHLNLIWLLVIETSNRGALVLGP